ncbi:MAG: hypothetical protein ACT4OP_13535 [Actinomycetota bacterium]
MNLVELRCEDWWSGPVEVASRFYDRWRGLRPAGNGRRLLLSGNSVHGVGMREPLLIVGLDRQSRILRIVELRPGKVIWIRGASQILELPIWVPPPPIGSVLTWSRVGSPQSLRHSDRESG